MKTTRKVTISDIAAAAGISKTTVSRYLNGQYQLMSEETRRRIAAVIEMSQYRPSAAAQSLKNQRSRLIGVVISDISSPFSASLVRGIGDALNAAGYTLLFANCDDDPAREQAIFYSLMDRDVEGFIVNTTSYENPFLINMASRGVPIVLCDRFVRDYNFPIASGEYRTPVKQLVRHLREQGYARVGFFTQEYTRNSPRQIRRDAFVEAMAEEYGAPCPENDVYVVDLKEPESIRLQLEKLLALCAPGEVPAVIGVNSITTMHMLGAVQRLGLSMPGQIGVCGPDDWSWDKLMNWTDLIAPGITSFSIDAYQVGLASGRLMLQRLVDGVPPAGITLPPSPLDIRASTLLHGAVPEGGANQIISEPRVEK